jgi:hypothetical protein
MTMTTLDDLRAGHARPFRYGQTPAEREAVLEFARLVRGVQAESLAEMPTPSQERH